MKLIVTEKKKRFLIFPIERMQRKEACEGYDDKQKKKFWNQLVEERRKWTDEISCFKG